MILLRLAVWRFTHDVCLCGHRLWSKSEQLSFYGDCHVCCHSEMSRLGTKALGHAALHARRRKTGRPVDYLCFTAFAFESTRCCGGRRRQFKEAVSRDDMSHMCDMAYINNPQTWIPTLHMRTKVGSFVFHVPCQNIYSIAPVSCPFPTVVADMLHILLTHPSQPNCHPHVLDPSHASDVMQATTKTIPETSPRPRIQLTTCAPLPFIMSRHKSGDALCVFEKKTCTVWYPFFFFFRVAAVSGWRLL